MASSSKKTSEGGEGVSPSRKGSKSRGPPVAAPGCTDTPTDGGHASSEALGVFRKGHRDPVSKRPLSRSFKIKLPKASTASQSAGAPSEAGDVVQPAPPSFDARDFMSILSADPGIKFKASREEIPASVGSSKRPRDSLVEGGSTGEGGGCSPKGEASSHAASAKEGSTPGVPKFVPDADIIFPPFTLDKTRSYFCAPELSYGVCCNLVTPKDRAHLHSKGLDGIRREGMSKQYQSMVLVNQAIFEAQEGYTKKVKDLGEDVAKTSSDLGESTTELEERLKDLKFHKRQLLDSNEARHDVDVICEDTRKEKESFLAEKMEVNAFKKQVKSYEGDIVSMYKDSTGFEESLASRFVDGFHHLEEQARVAYPQYDFEFEKFPLPEDIVARTEPKKGKEKKSRRP